MNWLMLFFWERISCCRRGLLINKWVLHDFSVLYTHSLGPSASLHCTQVPIPRSSPGAKALYSQASQPVDPCVKETIYSIYSLVYSVIVAVKVLRLTHIQDPLHCRIPKYHILVVSSLRNCPDHHMGMQCLWNPEEDIKSPGTIVMSLWPHHVDPVNGAFWRAIVALNHGNISPALQMLSKYRLMTKSKMFFPYFKET